MAWSCKETNRLDIDVSQTEADISIERWDQELFELTPVSMRKHHPRWKQEYGNLYTRYIEDVLQMGSVDDSNLFAHLRAFTTDVTIAEVQAQTQETYPVLDKLEEELEGGWKHFVYHFPDKEIPAHTSLITGFSAPLVLTEHGVGISLEMYLGEDCLFYDYLQFPMYLRQRMNADHLAPSVLKAWLETEFAMEVESPSLLDVMIHEGKVLYCMDAMFPTGHDSVKIGYSAKQLEWAKQHTEQVWAHLIDQELHT